MSAKRSRSSNHKTAASAVNDSCFADIMTLNELEQFDGSLDRFRHPLNPHVIFTPGVKYLIEVARAGWMIDAIASHIASKKFDQAFRRNPEIGFHFWNLIVHENRSAMLKAVPDKDEPPFIEQAISFTDFPLHEFDVWACYDGQHWTLLLPSEY